MEKQYVFYTDLMNTVWLGFLEDASDSYVGVKDYEYLVKRSQCYKVPAELCNPDLVGYKYFELTRNRPSLKFQLEPF